MKWNLWTDHDDKGPVQWPTRRPVRPRLLSDEPDGWLLPRLVGSSVQPGAWPHWLAGVGLCLIVAVLWVLAASVEG